MRTMFSVFFYKIRKNENNCGLLKNHKFLKYN